MTLPLTSFIRVHLANGTLLTAADGATWFAASAVSSEIRQEVALGTGSTGAGRGTVAFDPVNFTLSPSSIDPSLFQDVPLGAGLEIEVASYSGTGSSAVLVRDQVYGKATLAAAEVDADGSFSFSASYAGLLDSEYAVGSGGANALINRAGWNRISNAADNTGSSFDYAANIPAASLTGTPAVSVAPGALTTYVQFIDSNGNLVTGDDGATWFAVTASGLSEQLALSSSDLTSGSGTFTFGPASFTLANDSVANKLLVLQATGSVLKQVELASYAGSGPTATLVQDTLLKGVGIDTTADQADGSDAVSLSYVGLLETSYASGAVTNQRGYNELRQIGDNTTNTVSGAKATGVAAGTIGTPLVAPAAGALTYFVRFVAGDGTVLTGDGGATWFGVSAAGFGTASGTGGKISLQDLTFTLDPNAVLPSLLLNEAQGRFQSIELAGYDGNGSTAVLAQDTLFAQAGTKTATVNPDGTETFDVRVGGLKTQTPSSVFSVGLSGSGGFAAPSVGAPAGAFASAPLQYFVQIRTSAGALLTAPSGQAWFAVGDAGFSITESSTATSSSQVSTTESSTATSPSQGKLSEGALGFTFDPSSLLPGLLTAVGTGSSFTLELAGYDGASTLVQDDLFEQAAVQSTDTGSDGTEAVSYVYSGLREQTFAPNAAGQDVVTNTQGLNAGTNTLDTTTNTVTGGAGYAATAPTLPAGTLPAAAPDPGPLSYVIRFDSSDGASNSWFAVGDVSFGQDQAVSVGGSGEGAGSGKPVFNPLSFTLGGEGVAPALFRALAAGTPYEQIELAAYDGSGNLVQDNLFGLAEPTSLTQQQDGSETVSVQYGRLVEKSYAPDASGTPAVTATGGFDLVKGVVDTTPAIAAAAPLSGPPSVAALSDTSVTLLRFQASDGSYLPAANGAIYFNSTDLAFQTAQTSVVSPSSGASTQKVAFGTLTFTLAPGPELATLVALSASDKPLEDIVVAQYSGSGADATLVGKDIFKLAAVAQVTENADGSAAVSIDYAGLQEVSYGAGGGSAPASTVGFDQLTSTNDLSNTAYNPDGSSSGAVIAAVPMTGIPANDATACYCPGTLIATPTGEVPVEALAIGDLVLTVDGLAEPVRWIGRRSYHGRFVQGRRDILPVTIGAGALADGVPRRDLVVSPLHALLLDGMLIPAGALVNGTSVTRASRVDTVHYLHVELARHDVILAEGAPAETFLDDNSRWMFHNAADYTGPDTSSEYCAPRVESGYALEAVRRRIDKRARLAAARAASLPSISALS